MTEDRPFPSARPPRGARTADGQATHSADSSPAADRPGATSLAERAGSLVASLVPPTVKPKLRGWLHAVTFPLALVAGIALVAVAPTERARLSIAVFTVTAALLFGVSAFYHRGRWSPRAATWLRRLDHSNIFLLIAGTYTPFAATLLSGRSAVLLLSLVWGSAVLGVAFRVLWIGAPRWLYVPVYLAMGWSAAFWLPEFHAVGGSAVVTLVVVGGVLYVLGALAYAFRRPNPAPRWFGFHEVFHTFTVLAFVTHLVGISLAAWSVPPLV